jgi:hypothetical protein
LFVEIVFKKYENQYFKGNIIECGIQSSYELFDFPIEYIETSSKYDLNVRKCFHLSISQFWKNKSIQRFKLKLNQEVICKFGKSPKKELELSIILNFTYLENISLAKLIL